MARNVVIKSWPLLRHIQGMYGFSLISQSICTSTSTILRSALAIIYDKRETDQYRKFYSRDLKRKDNLGELDADRNVLLYSILKK